MVARKSSEVCAYLQNMRLFFEKGWYSMTTASDNSGAVTSNQVPVRQAKVTSCPDRLYLADCLLEGDTQSQVPLTLRVEEMDGSYKREDHVFLTSIEREDGSGTSFNLKGRTFANNAEVKIYISLRNRNGIMTFV